MSTTSFSVGSANSGAQGREVVDGREVERVDAVGDDLDLGLVDPEHVGDVALHVVAADDDALRAAHHPALDAVDVALRVLVDPALVAAVLGRVDRRQVRAPRRARQPGGGRRDEPVVAVHDVVVVALGEQATGREHVLVHALDPGHELVEVAGHGGLGHAMHANARPDLLGQIVLAPRVRTWTATPCATRPSESLRTWRARPPSTIGGYSQERMRMRRGTRGAGAYRRGDGAVAGKMAVLSRFRGPKRDKIVHPDTKSARQTYFRTSIRRGGTCSRTSTSRRGSASTRTGTTARRAAPRAAICGCAAPRWSAAPSFPPSST